MSDAHASTAADFRTITIGLGARSYDVVLGSGLLADAGALIAARIGARRATVVTDRNVAGSHADALAQSLARAGVPSSSIVLPPGESTKSFSELAGLCSRLLACGLERGDVVIALGGGVIGDLAGFAAAILRRGVRYVQIPTSLLAQVDSSVGGKTGINTPEGKNLIGAFHQPSLVLADLATLTTLPDRQMRAGYAEVVKYGLLGDRSFFDWLQDNRDGVLRRDPAALAHAVARSVAMKAEIVARDETETGERALLNLGHTFGHALEAWAGYSDRLLHGEAVAIGMCMAFRLSEELGHAPPQSTAQVAAHLRAAGLPTAIADIAGPDRPDAGRLLMLMAQDKKVRDGHLTLILARGIGEAFVTRDVTEPQIRRLLEAEVAGAS